MSANLEVVDLKGMLGALKMLDAATNRAARMAGGDAIRAVRTEGSKQIRARKRMKVAAVNKALTLTFPKPAKGIVWWEVRASGAVVPVSAFSPRQSGKVGRNAKSGRFKKGRKVQGGRGGVTVEINVGKRVLIRGAFIATMKSGHEGVFKRTGKGRLPIHELFTTRAADAFKDAVPSAVVRGKAEFESTFRRVLPLEVAKRTSAT